MPPSRHRYVRPIQEEHPVLVRARSQFRQHEFSSCNSHPRVRLFSRWPVSKISNTDTSGFPIGRGLEKGAYPSGINMLKNRTVKRTLQRHDLALDRISFLVALTSCLVLSLIKNGIGDDQ